MSLATRDSGRLAREISSSFPSVSSETSFFGNHQLARKDWEDNELSIIFSSSGGRSNGQGRNGAIRDKIYEQDEKIEQLTRALKEKKEKKKAKKRQEMIENYWKEEKSTTTLKVEEVFEEKKKEEFHSIEEVVEDFKEKFPKLKIETKEDEHLFSFHIEEKKEEVTLKDVEEAKESIKDFPREWQRTTPYILNDGDIFAAEFNKFGEGLEETFKEFQQKFPELKFEKVEKGIPAGATYSPIIEVFNELERKDPPEEEEKREDPLTLHSLDKKFNQLSEATHNILQGAMVDHDSLKILHDKQQAFEKEMLDALSGLALNSYVDCLLQKIKKLEERIEKLEPSSLEKLVD